jgi:hypothetical protein
MAPAGNNHQALRAGQSRQGLLIELDDYVISATDDQKPWRMNRIERITGEIGPPPARDYGTDAVRNLGGCNEGSRRAGTGAKQA